MRDDHPSSCDNDCLLGRHQGVVVRHAAGSLKGIAAMLSDLLFSLFSALSPCGLCTIA